MGLSTSSVLTQLVCDVIILLYLLDGSGTSWVVFVRLYASVAVEVWKVWKLLCPTLKLQSPFISVRQLNSGKEQETAKYDPIAFRYLAVILYPLVLIWSLYNLYHNIQSYNSWHSWLISNLVNAVYTFGFISLVLNCTSITV